MVLTTTGARLHGATSVVTSKENFFQVAFSRVINVVYQIAKKFFNWLAVLSYYGGYRKLHPELAESRRRELFDKYGAQDFKCKNADGREIDALYIPSPSTKRTGNVLLVCLNTTYQDHHPNNWKPFLTNGADIVLWNPSKLNAISYSDDLSAVLNQLRKNRPSQEIVVKTYCAGSDAGIRAAAKQKGKKVHLIIDRGHGNMVKLVKIHSVFSRIRPFQEVIREGFDCRGEEEIQKTGKILFIFTKDVDQVMDYKGGNLTRKLAHLRPGQTSIELPTQDHWGRWDYKTYNQTLKFLAMVGVVASKFKGVNRDEFPMPKQSSVFKRRCAPFLTKSYFQPQN